MHRSDIENINANAYMIEYPFTIIEGKENI
jgi:hypothetical protein